MQNRGANPAFIGGNLPLVILGFLLGIMVYFTLNTEPRVGDILPMSIIAFILGMIALWFAGNKTMWAAAWLLFFIAAVGGGAAYSAYRTALITPSPWPEQLAGERVWVKGTVSAVNLRSNGFATVELRAVTTFHPDKLRHWPSVVIITHNSRAAKAQPGGEVAAQARLKPPSAPLHPSEYDWRQKSFFEQVSATGLVMGGFYPTPPDRKDALANLRHTRESIANKYANAQASDGAKGVAAALLTGIRSQIPPETRENYAQSGLAHLMAISGMHLGMVAGFIYLILRFLLVRAGALPLHTDIRKPAAFMAFLAAGGYAVLAGATIPTIRALSLIGAAFLAILFDRVHLGIRILALIAFALAVYNPYWVAGPSFQLSFVASFALLLWAYKRKELRLNLGSLTPKTSRLADLFKVSTVAALATAPVVAAHFSTVPVLSVLANMLGVPFLGLVVLPLGFLSLLLPDWFFGGTFTALYLGAVDILNNFAAFIASQPASSFQMPPQGLVLFFVGTWGLLLAFIYRNFYVFAVAVLALVPFTVSLKTAPQVVALYHQDGIIALGGTGFEYYSTAGITNRDLAHLAETFDETYQDKNTQSINPRCDASYCVYKKEEGADALLTFAKPWADVSLEDCAHSRWILSPQQNMPCPGKNIISPALLKSEAVTYTISIKNGHVFAAPFKTPAGRPWHN